MSKPKPAALAERQGHALVITLNRPEAMNAVNADVSTAVGEAIEQEDKDAEVRAVVLTGAGGRAFCAGVDLKALSRGEDISARATRNGGSPVCGWLDNPVPNPAVRGIKAAPLCGTAGAPATRPPCGLSRWVSGAGYCSSTTPVLEAVRRSGRAGRTWGSRRTAGCPHLRRRGADEGRLSRRTCRGETNRTTHRSVPQRKPDPACPLRARSGEDRQTLKTSERHSVCAAHLGRCSLHADGTLSRKASQATRQARHERSWLHTGAVRRVAEA